MKAAQIKEYGGPEQIKIIETEKPNIKPFQILVSVKAASINPFDVHLMSGFHRKNIPLQLPITLGGDFAGIVMETGKEVTELTPGDEVYGQAVVANGGSGAIAQYVAANAKNTSRKPFSIDFSHAASLPLTATSAWQAINEHINIKAGQRILIHGGAGGIGSMAIQLAKLNGAYIATTVRKEAAEFVLKMGANEIIDYQSQNFQEIVAGYDAVFDTVGGETAQKSLMVLKPGGILVSMSGPVDEKIAKDKAVVAMLQKTKTDTFKLNKIKDLIDAGLLHPQIDATFPLEKTAEAFEYFETAHPKGKVTIDIESTI